MNERNPDPISTDSPDTPPWYRRRWRRIPLWLPALLGGLLSIALILAAVGAIPLGLLFGTAADQPPAILEMTAGGVSVRLRTTAPWERQTDDEPWTAAGCMEWDGPNPFSQEPTEFCALEISFSSEGGVRTWELRRPTISRWEWGALTLTDVGLRFVAETARETQSHISGGRRGITSDDGEWMLTAGLTGSFLISGGRRG